MCGRFFAQCVVARADIDRQFDVLRNDVDRAGKNVQLADRANQAIMRFAVALDEEHHFACRRERILPPAHRYGSGVAGKPRHVHAHPYRPALRTLSICEPVIKTGAFRSSDS